MVGDNYVCALKVVACAEERALFEKRTAVVAATPMVRRDPCPCPIRQRLDPTVQLAVPTALGVSIEHFLIQHRKVFVADIEDGYFLLILILQVIVQALQAHIAPAPLGKAHTKSQPRPLFQVWQILQYHLLLQRDSSGTDHDGFANGAGQRDSRQTVSGGFTGAGACFNHADSRFSLTQGACNLRNHFALTTTRFEISCAKPSSIGVLNGVFYLLCE